MNDVSYGGKGESLVKLKDNGFNVPSFFIIDSRMYEQFLEDNDLIEKIDNLIRQNKYNDIKEVIFNANISKELSDYIYEKFDMLSSEKVSVRSSASNEDGKYKSFAGQYNTYLNVTKEDLLVKIKLCWISLYSENVIIYNNDVTLLNGMNVIVQVMIDADNAGVAFSVDPTSETLNYSVIEVTSGVGEKLVSGEVTPTKFLVRRQTKRIDLQIGDSIIDEKLITELEIILLNIEKLYGVPVDIEFAYKNNELYILQARPITAIEPIPKSFVLSLTRPDSLLEEEIYYKGEYEGIKEITRNLYYFKPLFIYNSANKNTGIYYNTLDLEEDPTQMYFYLDLDYEIIKEKYIKVVEYVKELNEIIDTNSSFDIESYVRKLIFIYPFASLGQLAGHFDAVTDRVRNILYNFRDNYDYIIHKASDYLLELLSEKLPTELRKYSKFITLDEYVNSSFPLLEELDSRSKGYIYYDLNVITQNYEDWLIANNISIVSDNISDLKGNVVFGSAHITGKICKVFSEEDFDDFEEGDILVTPMTTPKFVKVISKSKAIITDEGGVTCHAAIISRELKIPCVVGCKSATKILNDGDNVRIDMSTGDITVL